MTVEPTIFPSPHPMPCPKCGGRAIRGFDGRDITIELADHDSPRDGELRGKPNGTRARIRVCEQCGNVYAGVLRISETVRGYEALPEGGK